MSATISSRWFWSDWMSDLSVRSCSYAARGLWMDMLCVAGQNKGREHGFVSLNGRKMEPVQIAKVTNMPDQVGLVVTLLKELKDAGVYSVDKRGVIYCRRMVRSEKYRANGRLGGNQNLLKNKENPNPVGPQPKALIPKPKPKPKPKPEPKIDSKTVKDRAGARTLLAENWAPSDRDVAYASEHGFTLDRVQKVAQSFADHHRARGNKMADWAAAWRTWVRNEIKFSGGRPRSASPQPTRNGFAALALQGLERTEKEHDHGADACTEIEYGAVSTAPAKGVHAMAAPRRNPRH